MKFCELYLRVPEGKLAGQPIRLAPFQEEFFYSVFDNPHGTRAAINSMARKNSKTATTACILICFLVGPEAKDNSQIVSGAMSRDQASIIFKLAVKMIQMSDKLRPLVKIVPSTKTLISIPYNVEFRALAADGATAQGLSVYLGIIDEPGQIRGPTSDFVDAIITSQGAYEDPLIIYLSTQAPTDADFFSLLIDDAIASADPHTVCYLYEAPANCDLMDHAAWVAANPALGLFRSEKDIEEQMKQAIRMPSMENTVRNLLLNQRVTVNSPFVSRSVWEDNGAMPEPLKKKRVYGGLDLSSVSDLTALVLVSEDGDVECFFWLPGDGLRDKARNDRVPYDVWEKSGHLLTTPGRSIEYEYIAYQLKEVFENYDIQQINFDRYNMTFLIPWLQKVGMNQADIEKFKEFGQGFFSMGPAVRDLEARLLQKKLKHGMHPVLTMCAGNAVIEVNPTGAKKFTKKKANGRIDGMVALAMAVSALAATDAAPKKEYQMFFV